MRWQTQGVRNEDCSLRSKTRSQQPEQLMKETEATTVTWRSTDSCPSAVEVCHKIHQADLYRTNKKRSLMIQTSLTQRITKIRQVDWLPSGSQNTRDIVKKVERVKNKWTLLSPTSGLLQAILGALLPPWQPWYSGMWKFFCYALNSSHGLRGAMSKRAPGLWPQSHILFHCYKSSADKSVRQKQKKKKQQQTQNHFSLTLHGG